MGAAAFIALASIFFSIRYTLGSDFITVRGVKVVGARDADSAEIASMVDKKLIDSRQGIFSKDNFLLLDKSEIASLISKNFPKYTSVSVEMAGLGALLVKMDERKPFANWCDSPLPNKCIFIDQSGIGYEDEKIASSTVDMIIVSESYPQVGAQVFSNDEMNKLVNLANDFDRSGYKIHIITKKGSDYFAELKNGIEVRFKENDSELNIYTNFSAVMNELKKDNNGKTVDYIDLRYGNKVYLKRN